MPDRPSARCIFCSGTIPANTAVEHFPVGKRIAFDPGRGRLWAVCPSCHRWNLAPFETRWEALEELEKTGVDTGRVLASTDNIALIRAPGVELVRVGEARLAEEAWWRYGTQMMKRRTRARLIKWTEQAGLIGVTVATGGAAWMFLGSNGLNSLLRWKRFGSKAWRGEARCVRCGAGLNSLTFDRAGKLRLARDDQDEVALHLRCWKCRLTLHEGEIRLEGATARHVLRRVVTYNHFGGASEKRVRMAADYIDEKGAPEAVTRELSTTGLRVGKLLSHKHRRTQAVALEIALNEENERRLLEMELRDLEARWREEEEIAAIVDGELTPVAGMDALRSEPGGP